MNAPYFEGRESDGLLLKLVDFKWLMSGIGWWVNLSRLQSDRDYVDECLRRALGSDSTLLRECSIELLGCLLGTDDHRDAATSFARSDHRKVHCEANRWMNCSA